MRDITAEDRLEKDACVITGKKREILCSTGTIVSKYNGRDYKVILKNAPDIDCDGFELMMVPEFYDRGEEIVRSLKEAGLRFAALHIEKDIGLYLSRHDEGDVETAMRYLELNFRFACELGINFTVLHLWGGAPSDAHIERNAQYLDRLLRRADELGLTLTVENVPCTTHTPYENIKYLTSLFPSLPVTFDTRFAAFHAQEDIFCSDDALWRDNIRHVHISDISADSIQSGCLRPILHPGEGVVQLDTVFNRLEKYDGTVTLESPVYDKSGENDIARLNKTLRYLKEKLG